MKYEESKRVAVAFRCFRALVIIVLDSIKNLSYLEAEFQIQQTPFCFHATNLRAAWVLKDIASCFVKSFPLPLFLSNIF